MLDGREAMRLSVSLPRRERRQITRAEVVTIVFQSTLPRRERPGGVTMATSNAQFQSTLPRRERRSTAQCMRLSCRHFNPRSREGSDGAERGCGNHRGISIHAPVKGATPTAESICAPVCISIHAPVKGATECDTQRDVRAGISIHAPVKGATFHVEPSLPVMVISIHAPVKGATRSDPRR